MWAAEVVISSRGTRVPTRWLDGPESSAAPRPLTHPCKVAKSSIRNAPQSEAVKSACMAVGAHEDCSSADVLTLKCLALGAATVANQSAKDALFASL